MIYLHKILPVLVSPVFLLIVLIAFSIWLKQRRYAVLAIVALWVMSMPIVSDLANANLERGMIRLDALDIDQADAIIVLSGMLTTVPARQNGELTLITEWGDPDRFFGGVELFKAGKAPRLIFTRGQVPWMKNSIPEGEYLKSTAIELGIAKSAILLTDIVTNTQEEAVASKALFDNAALKLNLKIVASPKIILVTSAFHMPRAQVMFEQQGFNVMPFPVDFKISIADVTFISYLPNAFALAETSRWAREMLGRFYYQIKPYLS
jgi:uncharacterized SAM-binding protein YcdF (DUF218 family)